MLIIKFYCNIFCILFQGAGDAFLGSLAYFIVHTPNLSLYEQIRRACIIATRTVQFQGTQKSYPLKHDLPEELFN